MLLYTYWLIEQLIQKPDSLEEIMDLALIFNSFLDLGFLPYGVIDQETSGDIPSTQNQKKNKKRRVHLNINPTIDEIRQNKFYRILQLLKNRKVQKVQVGKKWDNMFEAKNVLQKENLLKLNTIHNYWEAISIIFGELDTCRFASFNYKGAKTWNEKAIGWILLLIKEGSNLYSTFEMIYSIDFIHESLYDPNNNYIISCKDTILTICNLVNSLDLTINLKIIHDYENYKQQSISQRMSFNTKIRKQDTLEDIPESLPIDEGNTEELKIVTMRETNDSRESLIDDWGSRLERLEVSSQPQNWYQSEYDGSEEEAQEMDQEYIYEEKKSEQSIETLSEEPVEKHQSSNILSPLQWMYECSSDVSDENHNMWEVSTDEQAGLKEIPSQDLPYIVRYEEDDEELSRIPNEHRKTDLVLYLKEKHKYKNRRKRKTFWRSIEPDLLNQGTEMPEKDNFRLIKKWLAPMKKKRVLRSKSKSRNSSHIRSYSNSQMATPILKRKRRKLTKTELFYINDQKKEIETYIYSSVRYFIIYHY